MGGLACLREESKAVLLVLISAVGVSAQTPVTETPAPVSSGFTLKGHRLGETAAEFIQLEPILIGFGDPKDELLKTGAGKVVLPAAKIGCPNLWYFEGGKLSKIALYFTEGTRYESIRNKLTSEVGVQPNERTPTYQNVFGASWQNRTAAWDTAGFYALLYEDNNPADKSLTLVVTPAKPQRVEPKNPLD